MIALLDADMVAFRCAASANHDPLEVALERTDSLIDRIMQTTGATALEGWLTGSNNYRYDYNKEYKANRKDKERPVHLQDVREHLVVGWGCHVSDGNEADDELGITQSTSDVDTIIVSNDKDLLTIPGRHYNPVTEVWHTISPLQGLHNFYYQMIMGDSSDNIFGYDGKARQKLPKFLEPEIMTLHAFTEESDMYELIEFLYGEHDRSDQIESNAHCLYIQRKNGDRWLKPGKHLDSNQA